MKTHGVPRSTFLMAFPISVSLPEAIPSPPSPSLLLVKHLFWQRQILEQNTAPHFGLVSMDVKNL